MAYIRASSPEYKSLTLTQRLENAINFFADPTTDYYDKSIHQRLRVVSASPASPSSDPPTPAKCTFALEVPQSFCQPHRALHGGATATIFDACTTTSLCLVNGEGFWEYMGVSRTLSVTYLAPARPGETVEIECEVLAIGRRLAGLRAVMSKRGKDGRRVPVATCDHGKVNVDPKPKI